MSTDKLDAARRAKQSFTASPPDDLDVIGVGIGLAGQEPALKVNLRSPPPDGSALPDSIEGVPVIYQVVGKIIPR